MTFRSSWTAWPIRFHHIWFLTKHVIPKNCLLWDGTIRHLEKFLNQKRNINPSISLFERMGSSALGGSSQDEVSTQQPWLGSPLTGVTFPFQMAFPWSFSILGSSYLLVLSYSLMHSISRCLLAIQPPNLPEGEPACMRQTAEWTIICNLVL